MSTRNGHPLVTGILIGLLAGVGISAGVAVWVARMPSPFQNRALDNPDAPAAGRAAGGNPAGAAGGTQAPSADAAAPSAKPESAANPGSTEAAGGGMVGARPQTPSPSEPKNPADAPSADPAGNAGGAGSNPAGAPVSAAPAAENAGAAFIQVGAYTTEEDAQRQVEAVALATGSRAQVVPAQQGGRMMYRVRLGPYPPGSDTTELMASLKANGISTAMVRAPAGTH